MLSVNHCLTLNKVKTAELYRHTERVSFTVCELYFKKAIILKIKWNLFLKTAIEDLEAVYQRYGKRTEYLTLSAHQPSFLSLQYLIDVGCFSVNSIRCNPKSLSWPEFFP
jgi:hypothetical protein